MKKNFNVLIFFVLTLLVSCQNENQDKLIIEKERKQNITVNNLSKIWDFQFPIVSQEVESEVGKWKDWNSFKQELKNKPQTSISAFKVKVVALAKKVDSLHLGIPSKFNQPQVRSRIVAMQTKIQSLETWFELDVIPQQKVVNIVKDINTEIKAFYSQCEEIVVKSKIPKEIGETEMLKALDTARNAKNINIDELEFKETQNK